jgi:predicted lipoprotein with Yx(FWY)xxD motif
LAIAGCKQAWPALTTSGKPKAGTGVKKSLLGTITIAGGKHQVTYAGHPLYHYAFGIRRSTSYVGINAFGGFWYGVKASGRVVK